MPSKTSLLPLVRSFDWKAVAAGLDERPSLVAHRDERGRNWLHVCCATALDGRDARPSLRTADVLLARGIDLNDPAFTEGRWNVNAQNERGMTAAHLMLKKNSDYEHFAMLARYNARFDLPDKQGVTAADVMARKRDARFKALAAAARPTAGHA
jgi:hypothetical protein